MPFVVVNLQFQIFFLTFFVLNYVKASQKLQQ